MRSTNGAAFTVRLALALAARAVSAIQQRWQCYLEVRARERAVREIVLALRGLNAHTLRDVGLDVSRVYSFAPEAAVRREPTRGRLVHRATQCSSCNTARPAPRRTVASPAARPEALHPSGGLS